MHQWVMSYIWMSHVIYIHESCHIYEWVISHTFFTNRPPRNRSRLVPESQCVYMSDRLLWFYHLPWLFAQTHASYINTHMHVHAFTHVPRMFHAHIPGGMQICEISLVPVFTKFQYYSFNSLSQTGGVQLSWIQIFLPSPVNRMWNRAWRCKQRRRRPHLHDD